MDSLSFRDDIYKDNWPNEYNRSLDRSGDFDAFLLILYLRFAITAIPR